jgi:hypothetical protein
MTSESTPLGAGNSFELDLSNPNSRTIILHVLSPSPEAPNRITFNDLPLTTKVSELKDRLYSTLESKPLPETQRLIYRGKPLTNNDEALQNIIEPADVSFPSICRGFHSNLSIFFTMDRPMCIRCILFSLQEATLLEAQTSPYLRQPLSKLFRCRTSFPTTSSSRTGCGSEALSMV